MRFKLYALSYKALSYAEIKKDLNKEIYKENKTEKRQRLEIVYENLRNSENARIPEAPGRSRPPNLRSAPNFKKFQKIFRNSADFAPSRRILTHERKPRNGRFRGIRRSA